MTVDHIGESVVRIAALRVLGRIAAPLFLFVIAESVRYSKNRRGFICRLYIAGIFTGVFTVLMNIIFKKILVYTPGNILFTYLYMAIYICLLEHGIKALKEKSIKKICETSIGIIVSILPQIVFYLFESLDISTLERECRILIRDFLVVFFPPTLLIEYSLLFVIMGICFYFVNGNKQKCIVLTAFSLLSLGGSLVNVDLWPFNDFLQMGNL